MYRWDKHYFLLSLILVLVFSPTTSVVAFDLKNKFLILCEQPNGSTLKTLEQMASNVSIRFDTSKCETIYNKNQQKKKFVYSSEYLTDLRPLFYINNYESIYAALRSDVSEINFDGVQNLKHLKTLTIRRVDSASFSLEKPFPTVKNDKQLSFLTKLNELSLTNLGITNINYLKDLKELKIANISKNKISEIGPHTFPNSLSEIDLSNNSITHISNISNLKSIKSLNLAFNKFDDITNLKDLLSLKTLILSNLILTDNKLKGVNVISNLTNLEFLDLSGWNIISVDFITSLNKLENLNLQYNKLTNVKSLSSLSRLTTLNIMRNNIGDLTPLAGLVTSNNLDFVAVPNPLRACSPKSVEDVRAGIQCSGNIFNDTWNAIKRLFN